MTLLEHAFAEVEYISTSLASLYLNRLGHLSFSLSNVNFACDYRWARSRLLRFIKERKFSELMNSP